jgi:pyridoxine kinase
MRALGVDLDKVPTTLLSNHSHYPTTKGRVLEPLLVADLLRGVEERGLVKHAAIVLNGYLGLTAIADEVATFVLRAKRANPRPVYLCDPAMGDSDIRFFVPADLRATFAERLVPLADMVTPNAFAIAAWVGTPVSTPVAAAEAAAGIKPATMITPGIAAIIELHETFTAIRVVKRRASPAVRKADCAW